MTPFPGQEQAAGVTENAGTDAQAPSATPVRGPEATLPVPAATPANFPKDVSIIHSGPKSNGPIIEDSRLYPCGANRGSFMPTPHRGIAYRGVLEWKPAGAGLIYDYDGAIYTVDEKGKSRQLVVDANPGDNRIHDQDEFVYGFYGSLSPDGSQVVYSSCEYPPRGVDFNHFTGEPRESVAYEIAAIDIDGSNPRRLTETAVLEGYPVWAPDAKSIAYIRSSGVAHIYSEGVYAPGRSGVYLMAPNGGSAGFIPENRRAALYPPVWSPDSQQVAFLAYEGELERDLRSVEMALHVAKVNGTESVRLGKTRTLPTWSPDSEWLAFIEPHGGVQHIITSKPDGTRKRVWSLEVDPAKAEPYTGGAAITQVAWSPDGEDILFVVSGYGPAGVYLVRPDGSNLRSTAFMWGDLRVARSPNGETIALSDEKASVFITRPDDPVVNILAWRNEAGQVRPWNPAEPDREVDPSACADGTIVPSPDANSELVQDCQMLLGVRDAMAGTTPLEWGSRIPISEWEGITLGGNPLRVEAIELTRFPLSGSIPPEIGELTGLHALVLGGEGAYLGKRLGRGLTGSIPPELGNLKNLQYLVLVSGYLTGSIPPELGNLENLERLILSNNLLSGAIPLELGNLTNLTRMDLSINRLEGEIPAELSQLKLLYDLSVTENLLTGCVPEGVKVTDSHPRPWDPQPCNQ